MSRVCARCGEQNADVCFNCGGSLKRRRGTWQQVDCLQAELAEAKRELAKRKEGVKQTTDAWSAEVRRLERQLAARTAALEEAWTKNRCFHEPPETDCYVCAMRLALSDDAGKGWVSREVAEQLARALKWARKLLAMKAAEIKPAYRGKHNALDEALADIDAALAVLEKVLEGSE